MGTIPCAVPSSESRDGDAVAAASAMGTSSGSSSSSMRRRGEPPRHRARARAARRERLAGAGVWRSRASHRAADVHLQPLPRRPAARAAPRACAARGRGRTGRRRGGARACGAHDRAVVLDVADGIRRPDRHGAQMLPHVVASSVDREERSRHAPSQSRVRAARDAPEPSPAGIHRAIAPRRRRRRRRCPRRRRGHTRPCRGRGSMAASVASSAPDEWPRPRRWARWSLHGRHVSD